jgi:hypothetical protein
MIINGAGYYLTQGGEIVCITLPSKFGGWHGYPLHSPSLNYWYTPSGDYQTGRKELKLVFKF